MLLKLTSTEQDKVTVVNLDNVESMYHIFSPHLNCMLTKICFSGNKSFVIVKEDLQTIMELEQNYMNGIFQETNWETNNYEKRNFNSKRAYNENLY